MAGCLGLVPTFDWEEDMFSDKELLHASQAADALLHDKLDIPDRFVVKHDNDMKQTLRKVFPNSMVSKAKWAASLFEEWRQWRKRRAETDKDFSNIKVPLNKMTKDEDNYTISYLRDK